MCAIMTLDAATLLCLPSCANIHFLYFLFSCLHSSSFDPPIFYLFRVHMCASSELGSLCLRLCCCLLSDSNCFRILTPPSFCLRNFWNVHRSFSGSANNDAVRLSFQTDPARSEVCLLFSPQRPTMVACLGFSIGRSRLWISLAPSTFT